MGLDLNTIGFRVATRSRTASKELLDAYQECPTTDISDIVSKMFCMSAVIKPLYTPIRRAAGSALTIRVPPGDNLMVHVGIHYAGEGDMIVIDARGDTEYCMGGAIMCGVMKKNGVRGMVVDGAYRDGYELQHIDFPVFGRALQPRTPKKAGPGEINTVINCAGVPVHPGDIVVADSEGTVVVPLEFAELVLEKVRCRGTTDAGRWNEIAKFEASHQATYFKKLQELGCRMD